MTGPYLDSYADQNLRTARPWCGVLCPLSVPSFEDEYLRDIFHIRVLIVILISDLPLYIVDAFEYPNALCPDRHRKGKTFSSEIPS